MKYRHRVLGFLCLLAGITYLDRIAISVAGPRIQESLQLNPQQWGWVVGIFTLSYALFEIPTGRMGDRLGARIVLTRVVLWWSAFTAFTGLTSNYYVLLATRFMFGAGEAGAFPNIGITVSRWFPVAERARTMGFVWMSAQLGGAFAPLLIVPIQMRFGWRAAFYLLGVIGVFWSIAWYRWFRDTPSEKAEVTPAERAEIGELSQTDSHHLPWSNALLSVNLWALLLVAFFYAFALYFFISWLHTFLVKGRGFSENALLLSMAPGLLGACGNVTGGFLSDALTRRLGLKWGRRTVAFGGLTCAAFFMVATIFTTNQFATLLFLGLAYGGITLQQTVTAATVIDLGKQYVGGIAGLLQLIGNGGGFLFSVSFGYFVQWFGSYDLALIPLTLSLTIAALLWLRVDATEELLPEAEADAIPEMTVPAIS